MSLLDIMGTTPWLFVKTPETDFTRKCKLDLSLYHLSSIPVFFHGYRILVFDGSDFCTVQNLNELENHFSNTSNAKGYNLLHLNTMYDLCNRIFMDSIIQPGRKENEYKALIDMVDQSKIKEKAIVTANRGYENYNVLKYIAKHI